MPTVFAKWPGGGFSVIQAPAGFSMTDLFWTLDEEADPCSATLYLLKPKHGWSHASISYRVVDQSQTCREFFRVKRSSAVVESFSGSLKKLPWPPNIVRMAYRAQFGHEIKDSDFSKITAEEISQLPSEPTRTHEVAEIRAMKPFCGVYFAYDRDGSCHYVGESKNVPARVSRGRSEIGDRRIGVIECAPHERKRIESYYIGILNPPGNSQSTHRVVKSEAVK